MDKDIKKRWIEALRSGRFKQGQGELRIDLREDNKAYHCCLGVLCEIAAEDNIAEYKEHWVRFVDIHDRDDSSNAILPRCVENWAKLDSQNPIAGDENLTALNDGGYSFSEIADLIEEYL